jgi:hypothetical protein
MNAGKSLGDMMSRPALRQRALPASQRPVFAGGRIQFTSNPSPFGLLSQGRGAQHPFNQRSSKRSTCGVVLSAADASIKSHHGSQGGDNQLTCRPASKFAAFLAVVRAALFYITTFIFATPLFCVMLAVYPYVMLFDKYR